MPATDDVIEKALELNNLRLPTAIPVVDIEYERYTDSDGEPALRVWVVFDNASDAADFSGEDVGDLKFAIGESLRENGIAEFPYIFIVSEDERAELVSPE